MKNYEKFKTLEEQEKAHKQWCKDGDKIDEVCMNSQECDYCFELWLDREAEECEKRTCKDSLQIGERNENEKW